jgi:hypothetical protein
VLYVRTEDLPRGESTIEQLGALSFEAMPVPALGPPATVILEPLERDVPVAGVADQLLESRNLRRLLAQPLERVANPTQRAAQRVERRHVALSPPDGVASLEDPSGELRQSPARDVARKRRRDSECLDGVGHSFAAQRSPQPPACPYPLGAQVRCPSLGRTLIELNFEVTDDARFVAQPSKIVVVRTPAAESQPHPQPGHVHANPVGGVRAQARSSSLGTTLQVP